MPGPDEQVGPKVRIHMLAELVAVFVRQDRGVLSLVLGQIDEREAHHHEPRAPYRRRHLPRIHHDHRPVAQRLRVVRE